MSAGQPEEDEITWGSEELPIENMNKSQDGKTHLDLNVYLVFKTHSNDTIGFVIPSFILPP